MSSDLYLILALIILGLSLIYFLIRQQLSALKPKEDSTLLEWLKTTQSDIQRLHASLTDTLQRSDKNVTDTLQRSYTQLHERLDKATQVMGELKLETGKFSEIGRSMKDLQDFLNSPKLRGSIGEHVLADLLKQHLPPQAFSLQHRFKTGDIVDAAILTSSGIIPIDSKFPMENFSRLAKEEDQKEKVRLKQAFINDVKKHLRAISDKYIRTDENTLDFALMYIPSESVYYEITANSSEVQDYAQSHRVLPVSPATFYAFLKTILVSFEGQKIAQEAQNILKNLKNIQKAATQFGEHLTLVQKHLTNAHNNMTSLGSEYSHLQTKIDHTSSLPGPKTPALPD